MNGLIFHRSCVIITQKNTRVTSDDTRLRKSDINMDNKSKGHSNRKRDANGEDAH